MVYLRLKIVGIFPLKTWRDIVFFIYLCTRNKNKNRKLFIRQNAQKFSKTENFSISKIEKVVTNGKLYNERFCNHQTRWI